MPRTVSDGGEDFDGDVSSQTGSHRHTDSNSTHHHHGYKVGFPPARGLFAEFADGVKETFFADDPLREYKDQSRSKKLWLSLVHLFPVLDWARSYKFSMFKGDFIAGLTIASLCIPQDIGYAKLAFLPAHVGLYSSFVPPLVYAMMGSSRDIAIGPVAVVSLLLGTLLQEEIDPVKSPYEYSRLAFTATFFAGITQAMLGFFRLGFIIEFLSHAAIVGFMAGAAVTIALQQLKGFLGIKKFTKKSDIISVMESVWGNVHHGWNYQTILIGASFLAFLLTTKYIAKKNKKLFWVSAIAPLISVVISTFCVYITRADKQGVAIVKDIKQGINPPSFHLIYWSGPYLAKGFRIGVVAGMVALTEAIAIGRTFAAMKDYQIDGNKEMVALGTMNIVGSMTSCYVATGSFSRSAVNYVAGCKTAVSNVVMAIVVMLTLLLITPLFKYTPNAILASIIINAVVSLVDYETAYLIWKVDKMDFVALLGAFFGVVFASVEYGLLIAVAISLGKILLQVTRPRTALLGNLPRTTIYRNVEQYPEAAKVPGVMIVRVDSAIYFTNSNYVKERILRWLRDEEDQQQEQKLSKTEFLIVELSPVTDIDTSGIHALEELLKALEKRKIQLILANPGPAVIQKLRSAKFTELIGDDKIFLSVGDAVKKFAPKSALNV
ncbi:sulfate transporter 1.2 [Aegilops tauschii subsp. strangulata]|uniref:STAS domain-containing protein n=3 Tax=Aegilops tauschii subsp. strangulata TaxID=200361 RepID=A0A453IRH1_AEGTS|nr:sulfate transporter 1.2 [Aegilops tauschii subsp. strangulata]XP_020187151.1 sulfate transporter 1.2 [Aegilops tauschii subsp. strangulata]